MILAQLTPLFGTLLALTALLMLLQWQERLVGRLVSHRLGWRAVLITGWLGVPVHELSHLAFAALFGHRIIAWRLFEPDPRSGTLGYVQHACSRHTLWQRAAQPVIALAPLLGGGLVLAALLAWMLPAGRLPALIERVSELGGAGNLRDLLQSTVVLSEELLIAVWQGRSVFLPLQLYLAICVVSHLAPSRADLASALSSLMVLLLLLIGGAAVAAMAGWPWPVQRVAVALIGPLLALTVAVVFFQGVFVAVVLGCSGRRRGLRIDTAPPHGR